MAAVLLTSYVWYHLFTLPPIASSCTHAHELARLEESLKLMLDQYYFPAPGVEPARHSASIIATGIKILESALESANERKGYPERLRS
jgi:hypothetical protein